VPGDLSLTRPFHNVIMFGHISCTCFSTTGGFASISGRLTGRQPGS